MIVNSHEESVCAWVDFPALKEWKIELHPLIDLLYRHQDQFTALFSSFSSSSSCANNNMLLPYSSSAFEMMLHLVEFKSLVFEIFISIFHVRQPFFATLRLHFSSVQYVSIVFFFISVTRMLGRSHLDSEVKITRRANKRQIGGNMWLIEVLSATKR